VLEEHVGVFCGSASNGCIRIECTLAEIGKGFLVNKRCKVFVF
jgi:hypothetical protein